MALADVRDQRPRLVRGVPLSYLGYLVLAAIVGAWAWRAFHDPSSYDSAAAWISGAAAWQTGHPEHVQFWTGMPFLAGVMALTSRVLSVRATGVLVTSLNLMLALGAGFVLLRRLRSLLAPAWWWVTALAVAGFVPLMSTVWWKQFNLIALVLGAAGFALARQRRAGWAAAAIGLSLAIKPMVILLPFVLLARRTTRRIGALAIGWVIALNLAAQALMAARAGALAPLDPLTGFRNLAEKTKPSNPFMCHTLNFSPQSLVCRVVGGTQYWTLQRLLVWCLLLLLGAWVVSALRGRSLLSWDAFAFTCALSAMAGPLEWSHYQLMLAPLFLLLVFRFTRHGASWGEWAGLVMAFVLASLMWQPYGTLAGSIHQLLTGHHQDTNALSGQPGVKLQEGISELAQYVLVLTGLLWYSRRAPEGSVGAARSRLAIF